MWWLKREWWIATDLRTNVFIGIMCAAFFAYLVSLYFVATMAINYFQPNTQQPR